MVAVSIYLDDLELDAIGPDQANAVGGFRVAERPDDLQ